MSEKRILLIDDDDDVREVLALALRGEGYSVDVAFSAAQALMNLTEAHYELVIADWRLPDGDGTKVATFAEQMGAKTIVMSGYLFHMPLRRAEAGRMLMKPVLPRELIATVRECIGEVETRPPTGR